MAATERPGQRAEHREADPRGMLAECLCCWIAMPDRLDQRHCGRGPGGIDPTRKSALLTDLRQPGRDRDRERAAVQGAAGAQPRGHRGAGAADGNGRDPARHQQLADRHPAGVRRDRRERRAPVRRDRLSLIRRGGRRARSTRRRAPSAVARAARTVQSASCRTDRLSSRALLERRTVHMHGLLDPRTREQYPDAATDARRRHGPCSCPLAARETRAIGVHHPAPPGHAAPFYRPADPAAGRRLPTRP